MKILKILKLILLGTLSLTLQNCESDQMRLTKEEAEKQKAAGDRTDNCQEYGWYDDGICDDFCEKSDPECLVNCLEEPECQPGDVEIDWCPVGTDGALESGCVNVTSCGSTISCIPEDIYCLTAPALQCPEDSMPTYGECPTGALCTVVDDRCGQLVCAKWCSGEFGVACRPDELCRYQVEEICGYLNSDGF